MTKPDPTHEAARRMADADFTAQRRAWAIETQRAARDLHTEAQPIPKSALAVGTTVRILDARPSLDLPAGSLVIVKDTMDRATYNKPNRIGVGPADRGVAFGVALARIALP